MTRARRPMAGRSAALVLLLTAAVGTASASAQQRHAGPDGFEGITAARITRHIAVLADDSLLGRATPSHGLDAAAAYVAAEFRRAGLQPLEGSEFVIQWPLVTTHLVVEAVALTAGGSPEFRLVYGTDFGVMRAGRSRVTGRLVPVTDLADSSAIRGRIPLLRLPAGEWRAPAHAATFAARRAGAIGLVLILDSAQAVPAVAAAAAEMDHSSAGVPTALVAAAAGARLAAATDVSLLIPERTDTVLVPYVAGLLPGRDPALRHEYVVLSAHLDHLGVRAPAEGGDSIYNGADDNASGVAAVLESARVFGRLRPRPRRSVIFFTPTAEEICLCGSEHFTGHPPVPIDAIVADVNLDGIGRSWQADTVSAVGSPSRPWGVRSGRWSGPTPTWRSPW